MGLNMTFNTTPACPTIPLLLIPQIAQRARKKAGASSTSSTTTNSSEDECCPPPLPPAITPAFTMLFNLLQCYVFLHVVATVFKRWVGGQVYFYMPTGEFFSLCRVEGGWGGYGVQPCYFGLIINEILTSLLDYVVEECTRHFSVPRK